MNVDHLQRQSQTSAILVLCSPIMMIIANGKQNDVPQQSRTSHGFTHSALSEYICDAGYLGGLTLFYIVSTISSVMNKSASNSH